MAQLAGSTLAQYQEIVSAQVRYYVSYFQQYVMLISDFSQVTIFAFWFIQIVIIYNIKGIRLLAY